MLVWTAGDAPAMDVRCTRCVNIHACIHTYHSVIYTRTIYTHTYIYVYIYIELYSFSI